MGVTASLIGMKTEITTPAKTQTETETETEKRNNNREEKGKKIEEGKKEKRWKAMPEANEKICRSMNGLDNEWTSDWMNEWKVCAEK